MPTAVANAKLVYALARIARDPSRLDVVFTLADSFLDDPEATKSFGAILARPEMKHAVESRLRTPLLDLVELEAHAEDSFARAAALFFRAHELDPGALPRRAPNSDVEWLSTHLYETHDLWHVITGFAPDVVGELGLQAFYGAQIDGPLPVAILSAGLLNTVLFAPNERAARLESIARGWSMGKQARLLAGQDWMQLLPLPLETARERLGIVVDPKHDVVAAIRTPRV